MNLILTLLIVIFKIIIVNTNDNNNYYFNHYTFVNVPEKTPVYITYDESQIWKDGIKQIEATALDGVSNKMFCFYLHLKLCCYQEINIISNLTFILG